MDEIANQIKRVRLSKNMAQVELARKAEVSQQYISLLERGALNPSLMMLSKIAKILDMFIIIR